MTARLQAIKGTIFDDEALLIEALQRAEDVGMTTSPEHMQITIRAVPGMHGQFEKSLAHVARAIELLGAEGEHLEQAIIMTFGGRCYSARAGRLEEAFAYARRVQRRRRIENPRLRALGAMKAEPSPLPGNWKAVIDCRGALPAAWEIREWNVVVLRIGVVGRSSYLKLGRTATQSVLLDRVFNEVPLHAHGSSSGCTGRVFADRACSISSCRGDTQQALGVATRRFKLRSNIGSGLEQGAFHRILGEIYRAMGQRDEADAAFRRSLDILEAIQSRPELAQTLLAYGRFRRGDNRQEDRALIERALRLFEEINAPGWVEEARAALAAL